ncbi:hypothetical protein G4V62_18655 [Bacillaceae bacterium SIJ1]|uniref:hypothetical protein n=1 Tax=Litoribacterium kuwaitense TaxID=1398745 RepID=UPI0013EAB8DF|nr:hypothetical protein [Litoribacterium kuwaitense]NGP46860.1 hypothetical protein [Litoribacterium kuwaitense]
MLEENIYMSYLNEDIHLGPIGLFRSMSERLKVPLTYDVKNRRGLSKRSSREYLSGCALYLKQTWVLGCI